MNQGNRRAFKLGRVWANATSHSRWFPVFPPFKDDFRGWTVVHFMKSKSEVETPERVVPDLTRQRKETRLTSHILEYLEKKLHSHSRHMPLEDGRKRSSLYLRRIQ